MPESLDRYHASFDAAAARSGLVRREFVIAGHRVRVEFAGDALLPVMEPALAHLAANHDESSAPNLAIQAWDAASTDVPPLALPADALHHGESGPRYHGEDDGVMVHVADAALSIVEAGSRTALHYVPDADDVLWYQKATPLKDIVHAWAGWHDLRLIHAAAVGHRDGGVLIAGSAGAGKSTTSVACLRAGLGFAGDDYVLVDVERGFVHSVYSSAKLEWDNLEQRPELFRPANSRTDAKALAFLTGEAPERISSGFPLQALLLPTITGHEQTRAVPTTPARALLALAPSTLLQMPGHDQSSLGALRHLVARVPAFRLELGTNVAAVPDAVEAVLRDASPR